MIYPIVAYGDPVLKRISEEIDEDFEHLDQFIDDMFETMYNAKGLGLAAPQVGKNIRLFIVDCAPFAEDEELDEVERKSLANFKEVFINPEIIDEVGDKWVFPEGCLSIPEIREDVQRKSEVTINYFDRNFEEHTITLVGYAARVIQHEYDHIEGILITDHFSPLKKRMLKGKLSDISSGVIDTKYKMRFYNKGKR